MRDARPYIGQHCFRHWKDRRTKLLDDSFKLRDVEVEENGRTVKYKECPKCFIRIKADTV